MNVPVFLFHLAVGVGVSVILFSEELREILSAVRLVHEDDELVEVDLGEQLQKNRDLLLFLDLQVVLVETVKHQLGAVLNEDFQLLYTGSSSSSKDWVSIHCFLK